MASGDIIFEALHNPPSITWDGRYVSTSGPLVNPDPVYWNLERGEISLKLRGGDEPPYGAGWPDRLSKIQPGRQYKITITEV